MVFSGIAKSLSIQKVTIVEHATIHELLRDFTPGNENEPGPLYKKMKMLPPSFGKGRSRGIFHTKSSKLIFARITKSPMTFKNNKPGNDETLQVRAIRESPVLRIFPSHEKSP